MKVFKKRWKPLLMFMVSLAVLVLVLVRYPATTGSNGENGCLEQSRHIETLDTSGDVGLYTSIALALSRFPHIGYYGNTGGDLKYACYGQLCVAVDLSDFHPFTVHANRSMRQKQWML